MVIVNGVMSFLWYFIVIWKGQQGDYLKDQKFVVQFFWVQNSYKF
jgi:hypothetical protein